MSDDLLMRAAKISQERVDQTDVPEASKEALAQLITTWLSLSDRIEAMESELSELKHRREVYKNADIPAMMKGLGLVSIDDKGKFELADGTKIYLKREMYVSVKAENADAAKAWLRSHDAGHCIKEDFSTKNLKDLMKRLVAAGTDPDDIKGANKIDPMFLRYNVLMAIAMNRPLSPETEQSPS